MVIVYQTTYHMSSSKIRRLTSNIERGAGFLQLPVVLKEIDCFGRELGWIQLTTGQPARVECGTDCLCAFFGILPEVGGSERKIAFTVTCHSSILSFSEKV